ncbi:MAG: tRNA (N6-isopentenyl adenosine(37)-C2)-methylthiotransferase MiaB [Actinobacteria bacterium]|nr:tRNA (N6-isopentenyl adenosine(37)-C2)-methylthiotransferase MiaB [Actinomycetota bacterium]
MDSSAHPASGYYLKSFGCQMNDHDTLRVAGLFESSGMHHVQDPSAADVVFVNTCCIRENADNKLYGFLGQLKALRAERPSMRIVVGGCLAQREGQRLLERAPFVDVVVGTYNLARIPALLESASRSGQGVFEIPQSRYDAEAIMDVAGGSYAWSLPMMQDTPWSAYVSIQSGCDNSCTFCTVPMVRGSESSRPMRDIIDEVAVLAGRGVSEVTLLGQNVNSYGRDITRRSPLFAPLLREVGAVDGIRRIRFTSPHPKDLRPDILQAMAEVGAVCEQLHLPLQSGSDRVLSRMHRGYNAERYLARLSMAREVVPDLAVTTDIIVGFPGETEDDFEDTLEVVARCSYDAAYTFEFSPRPGTRAADMTEQFVDAEEIKSRFSRLVDLVERSAYERNQARIGKVEEVLVEGISKRDPSVLTGRTRQGKLVHFTTEIMRDAAEMPGHHATAQHVSGQHASGQYVMVRITGAGPHHLKGDLDVAQPVSYNQSDRRILPAEPAGRRQRIPIRVFAGKAAAS